MTRITGGLWIAAPPTTVFDTVADSRNEPAYNPDMAAVEMLTPPPVGPGTRFRALMGRANTPMDVELTEFERPHRVGFRTSSRLMLTDGALTFAPSRDGTDMVWDWQVTPRGWLHLLRPLLGLVGARMEHRIWSGLKRHLETGGAPPTG